MRASRPFRCLLAEGSIVGFAVVPESAAAMKSANLDFVRLWDSLAQASALRLQANDSGRGRGP